MSSRAAGDIRAPQLVGMYGPGAIVNLERMSVMPTAPRRWTFFEEISSPTFARQISAETLIDTVSLSERGIDAVVFPRTFVCRRCGRIQRRTSATVDELDRGFRCEEDSGALFPSRWIVYCPAGHISDFDYSRFVHDGKECSDIVRLHLGATIAQTSVACKCGAQRSMRDAYLWASRRRCTGERPWIGSDRIDCLKTPKLSMRSASDVYFGAVRSAITIEPESDPLVRAVFKELNRATPAVRESLPLALQLLRSFNEFSTVDIHELTRAINEYASAREESSQYVDRRYQEYQALGRESGGPQTDLWIERVDSRGLERFGVCELFAVRKLREVRALVGFQRGAIPVDPGFDGLAEAEGLAELGPQGDRRYPAYENRGEGIFFKFDVKRLEEWLKRIEITNLSKSFQQAERRYRESSGRGGNAPRRALFVLAHSFAHLVIRQVSLFCGYSQASLRERIFAANDDVADPWAGVLVYTASSDADGSLGGLVAQALEGNLATALLEGLSALRLCSSDPVCALREPRGFRRLSASACHACLVLPETSCERNNTFLDRNTVIPGTVNANTDRLCFTLP